MKTRHTDPIMAEVQAIRQAYAARFDYDVDAIFRETFAPDRRRPGETTCGCRNVLPFPRAATSATP